jgi:hypothetical protein
MATVILPPVSQILLVIQAAVCNLTGLGTEAVHIVAKKEIRFQADKEIYIRPGAPVRDAIVADGSGRYAMLIRRPITIDIGCRCALDTINDGTVALCDTVQGLGLFQTEEQVLQLTDTVLVDGANNALLWEPIRFIGGGEPPVLSDDDEASIGMNQSTLVFEIAYMADLVNPAGGTFPGTPSQPIVIPGL